MNRKVNPFLYIIFFIVFIIVFIIKPWKSDTNDDKDDELSGVNFSGTTASFSDYVEDGTLVAQHIYEYGYLKKIYYILKKGGINEIKINITDECKDSYGYISKRHWHKTLTPDWEYWNDALNYKTADDFAYAHQNSYPISSDTDEGTWYCCGRDPGCN